MGIGKRKNGEVGFGTVYRDRGFPPAMLRFPIDPNSLSFYLSLSLKVLICGTIYFTRLFWHSEGIQYLLTKFHCSDPARCAKNQSVPHVVCFSPLEKPQSNRADLVCVSNRQAVLVGMWQSSAESIRFHTS